MSTLAEALYRAAERFAKRPAIVDRRADRTIDFRQLKELAEQAARAWLARGLGRGDRVAIWAPNSWAWQVAALGVHLAGGVLVPLNTRFKGREAAALIEKTRARALILENGFLGIDYASQVADFRGPVIDLATGWSAFLGSAGNQRLPTVDSGDLSDIIFTSGTTGHPKGVLTTHRQSVEVFRTWSEVVGLGENDRYLVVNPYFHTFGYKAGWLACLLTGATCLPEPVFDAGATLRRIERDRITVLPGPPTLYQSLLDHPDRQRHDLSSLRLAVTGAATIPVSLVRRMRDELGFETVLTAYGLSETTGVVTMTRPGDDLEIIARTSGRAIPGVEVRIVDGEVRVRGYNVMSGYFEDGEESAAAFDEEGWLRTGDIGVLDEHGNLRITDRLKDMFIVGGFNAYPAEIENALLEHTAVQRAAVVGAPDERMGEVGVAFVVLKPGASVSASEIIEWARGRMANYKVPRRVELVGELPLNAVGKVLKHVLRARAAQGRAQQ